MLRGFGLILFGICFTATAAAQANTCGGLNSVDDSEAKLVYPPIAKAAHIGGLVLLLATLERDGSVSATNIVSGPEMLRASAVEFVKHWRVNEYTGPRTCPIAISYYLNETGTGAGAAIRRSDPQHVSSYSGSPQIQTSLYAKIDHQHYAIHAETPCLCDPSGVLGRRKLFGLF